MGDFDRASLLLRWRLAMSTLHRRDFLKATAAATTLSALTAAGAADQPNDRILLAVMGLHGRGKDLIRGFSSFEDVEIAYLIDPDERVVPAAIKMLNERQKKPPIVEKDIRRVLEDKNLTALAVAAPDHWHTLATIWACQAGKHVYCEKPVSHNILEGRRMVEAARKYNRVVQAGTQRRSSAPTPAPASWFAQANSARCPSSRPGSPATGGASVTSRTPQFPKGSITASG
jgi:uncharacterized protein (DUF1501 family)